jgi:hypothetical protein
VTGLIHQVHKSNHHHQPAKTVNNDTAIHHKVTAVLGLSPAVSHEQRLLAEKVADHIGVEFETVDSLTLPKVTMVEPVWLVKRISTQHV